MAKHFLIICFLIAIGCYMLKAKEFERFSIDLGELLTHSLSLSSFEEQPKGIYSEHWGLGNEKINLIETFFDS